MGRDMVGVRHVVTTTITPSIWLADFGLTERSPNEWYDDRGEPALELCADGRWSVYVAGEHYGEMPTRDLAVAVWLAMYDDAEWRDLIGWAP